VAGTAVVLAVGVVAATMALSAVDDEAVTPAPVAAASPERRSQPAGKRTPRLSARRRAERRRALDQLRRHGYRPVKPADYRPEQVLRVLIGEPVGTTPAGLRAFFFARGEYIGQDATSASLGLRPGRQREREITLVYKLYQEGDRECCPEGGKARVRFRWTGEALEPRDAIPPDYQRLPATVAQ